MVKLHVNKELLFYYQTGLANIWDYIIFLCLKSKPPIINLKHMKCQYLSVVQAI